MGILRSETMKHGTLILPAERARFFVELLGRKVQLQIEDMNHLTMRRNYRKYIQRIEDIERSLRFITQEIDQSGVAIPVKKINDQIDSFLENAESYKLDQVELEVKDLYRQFLAFRTNNADMLAQRNAAIEEKYVAHAASIQLRGSSRSSSVPEFESVLTPTNDSHGRFGLLEEAQGGSTMFSNLAGVILQSDQERFARTMFRATRGNAFTEFHYIPEPLRDASTGQEVMKSVFVVYHQGSSSSAMYGKISKICQSFNACIYAWPRSAAEALEQMQQADQLMADKRSALVAYEKFLIDESECLYRPVRDGTGNSLIEEYRLFCAKERSIYATLNLFEGDVTLRADCWYPSDQEDEIKGLLMVVSFRSPGEFSPSSSAPLVSAMLLTSQSMMKAEPSPSTSPPTYIKDNDITRSFQLIVDTYGVPRYKEANPALFATVSFPFLFGVMFGDVGHGFMLLMVGVYGIMHAETLRSSKTLKGLFDHRFLFTAMGFFAIYAGLIYSEFFAIGLNLFGSRWSCPSVDANGAVVSTIECVPLYDTSNSVGGAGPYPFGIDPAWDVASNQLLFVNSLKMKISVLFGVTQMLLGIYLKFANSIYFRNYTDLLFECIPQLAFMLAFFAYMDYLIMFKWVTPLANPPGLIDTMITLGLSGGSVRDGSSMFPSQSTLQGHLFVIGLISLPLMLIPKPLILWAQHQWKSRHSRSRTSHLPDHETDRSRLIGSVDVSHGGAVALQDPHHEEEEFEIGEIAIHQAIETIEYVLGTVSHTASYLRLWALSLAHQQLSLVFLEKTIYAAMSSGWPMILNAIPIYIGFTMFLGVTVGILLGMDVMECFLHTLRLHWVEFQSKFYKADGIKFKPFSHRTSVEEAAAVSAETPTG